jgi:hypothetical protein
MSRQHEHEFEAAPGLPEKLPAGEYILWQGAPEWRGLGVSAFGLRTVALYLVVMWLLQFAHLWDQGSSALEMAKYLGMSGGCAALALNLPWRDVVTGIAILAVGLVARAIARALRST